MKIEIYNPSEEAEVEVIHTFRLNKFRDGTINLDVVNPGTGLRLPCGTLMKFYPNGKVTFRRQGGCRQGGYNCGRIQEKV